MIYFLFGEDSYRAKKKLEEIVGGYKKVHKSGLNLIYIDAKEKTFSDFYSNFKITSMFAEKKLIVLHSVFASTKFQEEFLEHIGDIELLKDIVVIFEKGKVDQRLKIFKILQKKTKIQEFKFLQPAQLKKWVQDELSRIGAKISPDALNIFCSYIKNDLWRANSEIAKLASYKKGEAILRQDVELLVKPDIENDIFKTIDAIAQKNKKQALELLHKHLEEGEAPLYLLSMITYQFRNLLIVKELAASGLPYHALAKKSGLHPFVVQKTFYASGQFSFDRLKSIYYKIFEIDSDIKTGEIDAELALDLLVSEI